jgi:hypothetical protein
MYTLLLQRHCNNVGETPQQCHDGGQDLSVLLRRSMMSALSSASRSGSCCPFCDGLVIGRQCLNGPGHGIGTLDMVKQIIQGASTTIHQILGVFLSRTQLQCSCARYMAIDTIVRCAHRISTMLCLLCINASYALHSHCVPPNGALYSRL